MPTNEMVRRLMNQREQVHRSGKNGTGRSPRWRYFRSASMVANLILQENAMAILPFLGCCKIRFVHAYHNRTTLIPG
jgi:hypothetical protein